LLASPLSTWRWKVLSGGRIPLAGEPGVDRLQRRPVNDDGAFHYLRKA
jgi:hypothetical protein